MNIEQTLHQSLENAKKMQPYHAIYSTHAYILLFLNSILFSISLYYIKYSKLKSNYEFKPIAINALFTCWMLMLLLCLTQPIALQPYFGGYIIGVTKVFGPTWIFIEFWLCYTCFFQLGAIFSLSILMQSSRMQMVNANFLIKKLQYFDSSAKIWRFLAFSLVFHALLVGTPILIALSTAINLSDLEEYKEFSNNQYPLAIRAFQNSTYFQMALYFFASIVLIELTCSLAANLFILRFIRQTKNTLKRNTLRMQLAMYKMTSLQFLTMILFFYVPNVVNVWVKTTNIEPIYAAPFILSTMMWYYPATFIINLIQFPSIRRVYSNSTISNNFSRT